MPVSPIGHTIKISIGAYTGGGTQVEIDGVEVKELVSVKFEHEAGGIATVTLKIFPSQVDIEGEVNFMAVNPPVKEMILQRKPKPEAKPEEREPDE